MQDNNKKQIAIDTVVINIALFWSDHSINHVVGKDYYFLQKTIYETIVMEHWNLIYVNVCGTNLERYVTTMSLILIIVSVLIKRIDIIV